MEKRRFIAASVGGICGIIAACVGDDPGVSGPPPGTDGGGGADTTTGDPPETSTEVDANAEASTVSDPKNCGAVGHDCLGGECVNEVCQPVIIASGQNRPLSIVLDATHVYWINGGSLNLQNQCDPAKSDGSIARAERDGSDLVRIADGLACPTAIALGPDGHVWFNINGAGPATASIVKVPKDVNGTTAPTVVHSGLAQVNSIMFDGPTMYWTDDGELGRVVRAGPDGGAPTTVAREQTSFPRHLRAEGSNLYWISGYNGAPLGPGAFRVAPKTAIPDGGFDGSSTFVSGPHPYLNSMTTTPTHSYYSFGSGAGAVVRGHPHATGAAAPLAEGTPVQLVRTLAADTTHLYLATKFTCLSRVNLATSQVERFATIGEPCSGLAIDATSVFVSADENGRVRRIRKPAK
jgi:hypothetical protein